MAQTVNSLSEAKVLKLDSPFKKELHRQYLRLIEEKARIEVELATLKEVVSNSAPELLVTRKALSWTYKPGIHKLPQEFFKLDGTKVGQVYKSALGGETFLSKYGLSCKETLSYSWSPSLTKGVK